MATPDKNVALPNGQIVAFPGDMADMDISTAIQKNMLQRPDLFGAPAGIKAPANPMNQYAQEHSPAAGVAAMSGGSPNLRPASDVEGVLGGAGLGAAGLATYGPMAASAALPFLRKHPVITGIAGQEMIRQARQLPVVGRYIPAMAEYLPWVASSFLGGGKPRIGGEPDATLNRTNIPEYAGEDFGPTEPTQLQQSKPLGSIQARPDEPQAPSPTPERFEMTPERQNLFQRMLGQTTAENEAAKAQEAASSNEDLTPILKKSLQQARARKAIGAGAQGTQQP